MSENNKNIIYEIYDRQKKLPINLPEKIIIVGLGGVGFWAAVFLAMAGARRLWLIDHDVVETVNLNKLPLSPDYVGLKKVYAAAAFIKTLRPWAEIHAIPYTVEEAVERRLLPYAEAVIDARDINLPLPDTVLYKTAKIVEARYDGHHVSITVKPKTSGFETEPRRGYAVASWVGGAAAAGLLAALALLLDYPDSIISFDLREIPEALNILSRGEVHD